MRSDNTTLEEELLLYAVTDRSWLAAAGEEPL